MYCAEWRWLDGWLDILCVVSQKLSGLPVACGFTVSIAAFAALVDTLPGLLSGQLACGFNVSVVPVAAMVGTLSWLPRLGFSQNFPLN